VLFKPYEGRDQVLKVLRVAERVLGIGERFRYAHQLDDPSDRVAILEFATEVDGKQVEGIDKLTFDEGGRITELKVMIRPASALQVVGERMAEVRTGRARSPSLTLNTIYPSSPSPGRAWEDPPAKGMCRGRHTCRSSNGRERQTSPGAAWPAT
jgi:hypothetical protein